MTKSNRDKTRVQYSAHVSAEANGRDALQGTVRDISLDSIYINIEPAFAVGEEVSLEVSIFGKESKLCIKVSANVVRKDSGGVALRFIRPLEWWPVFSFFPLHSLEDERVPAGLRYYAT